MKDRKRPTGNFFSGFSSSLIPLVGPIRHQVFMTTGNFFNVWENPFTL